MTKKRLIIGLIIAVVIQIPWAIYAISDMKKGAIKTTGTVVDRTGRRGANPVYEYQDQQGSIHRTINHFQNLQSTNLFYSLLVSKNGTTATVYYKASNPAQATVIAGLGFYAALLLPLVLYLSVVLMLLLITLLLHLVAKGYIFKRHQ